MNVKETSQKVSNLPLVNLWGAFSVTSADGGDLTPKLAKCQALLALLATAKNGVRTRSWLQSKLWSDRSREQANGSLRQALALIRKALDVHRDVLAADRLRVSLDLDAIHIADQKPGEEFLAGMDIRDEEFEDWMRQERNLTPETTSQPSTAPAMSPLVSRAQQEEPVVYLTGASDPDNTLGIIKVFLIDSIARTLRENFSIRTFSNETPSAHPNVIQVQLSAALENKHQLYVAARCVKGVSTELLWSGHQIVTMNGAYPFENLDLLGWINELVSSIAEYIGRQAHGGLEAASASQLGLSALRDLFSLDTQRVQRADQMLSRAYHTDPRAIFLAWQAQLRAIQLVERHTTNTERLREEGLMLARNALDLDPTNSSVLATVANARLILDGDVVACDTLSKQSVAANASNPLAWWSLAFNYLYTDRPELALQASERGHLLSRGSPYRFWWEMQVSLAATAARHHKRAILAAERCAVFGPDCRPPVRYLVALHAREGSFDRAAHWAQKLQRLEPDFTPTRLIQDGDYPASLLRKYDLVTEEQLKPVADIVL